MDIAVPAGEFRHAFVAAHRLKGLIIQGTFTNSISKAPSTHQTRVYDSAAATVAVRARAPTTLLYPETCSRRYTAKSLSSGPGRHLGKISIEVVDNVAANTVGNVDETLETLAKEK